MVFNSIYRLLAYIASIITMSSQSSSNQTTSTTTPLTARRHLIHAHQELAEYFRFQSQVNIPLTMIELPEGTNELTEPEKQYFLKEFKRDAKMLQMLKNLVTMIENTNTEIVSAVDPNHGGWANEEGWN